MTEKKLIGKKVWIKKNVNSSEAGNWGIIKYFDGEEYHVAMNNGNTLLVFTRSEFTIAKNQK